MNPGELERRRGEVLADLNRQSTLPERNRRGQFATPSELASQIIQCALDYQVEAGPLRFLEPGLGTGAFFSALLRSPAAARVTAATGIERDPRWADAASALWSESRLKVVSQDFLELSPPARENQRFNLVVCNPPYVRHHHLSAEQKRAWQAQLKQHTGVVLDGLSGLYTYFLLRSLAWMKRGAVGAWLIPREFMDVRYGGPVRRFLAEDVTTLRVHVFAAEEVQFADALVTSAVIFFRHQRPPQNHSVVLTRGGLAAPRQQIRRKPQILATEPKWSRILAAPQTRATRPSATVLSDFFRIQRGLATGCNTFFVLDESQLAQRGFSPHAEFLAPLLPTPRLLRTDEVLADTRGAPLVEPQRFLLNCTWEEAEVRRRDRHLFEYLQEGRAAGLHLRYLCRHRSPWYSQERRPPTQFLCTYMGRSASSASSPFRFVLNHSRALASNVYLLLYPLPALQQALDDSPSLARVIWNGLQQIGKAAMTREGRIYGGGLHKLEPRELGQVAADALWKRLADFGGRSLASRCLARGSRV